MSRSLAGALITMSTVPRQVRSTPSASRIRKSSPRKTHAMTALDTTPTAPNGVTMSAPANPKARKLPTSPATVPLRPSHHIGLLVNGLRSLSGFASLRLCTCFCTLSEIEITRLPAIASTIPVRSCTDSVLNER